MTVCDKTERTFIDAAQIVLFSGVGIGEQKQGS